MYMADIFISFFSFYERKNTFSKVSTAPLVSWISFLEILSLWNCTKYLQIFRILFIYCEEYAMDNKIWLLNMYNYTVKNRHQIPFTISPFSISMVVILQFSIISLPRNRFMSNFFYFYFFWDSLVIKRRLNGRNNLIHISPYGMIFLLQCMYVKGFI